MIAVDTSVLVAAQSVGHVDHHRSSALLLQLQASNRRWGIPIEALVALLQSTTLTLPRITLTDDGSDALSFVHRLVNSPRCSLLLPEGAYPGCDSWRDIMTQRIINICRQNGVSTLFTLEPGDYTDSGLEIRSPECL